MIKQTSLDPLQEEPIHVGPVEREQILEKFSEFPWSEMLLKVSNAKESAIYSSPTISFDDTESEHGIEISIVEDPKNQNGYVYYAFYARPKEIEKGFFRRRVVKEIVVSELLDQNIDDCLGLLELFIRKEYSELERRFEPHDSISSFEDMPT